MYKKIYVKLAVSNLKKNRKAYLPYMITSILTILLFYDMYMITDNTGLSKLPGSASVGSVLGMGSVLVGIFACIFLFYTNNFLIKQRKKEIGLYNVLGMGKGNIAVMMFWESFLIGGGSILTGCAFGILFGKLIFLILYRILDFPTSFDYEISVKGIAVTAVLFSCIFLATLVFNLFQIRHLNPVDLLKGGKVGEKEPKTKRILALFGVVTIGIGYFIANTVNNPVEAIFTFFIAVMLVIAGTYALFVAGSIAFLKMLRRNKHFYYHPKHFHSVSGMIYRMKQNAVGLANICILSTMVLITVSTTVSLNMGMDNILRNRFPKEYILTSYTDDAASIRKIDSIIAEEMNRYGLKQKNGFRCHYVSVIAEKEKDEFRPVQLGTYFSTDDTQILIAPVSYYNEMCQEEIALNQGEAVVFSGSTENYNKDRFILGNQTYKVVKEAESIPMEEKTAFPLMEEYILFVKDESVLQQLLKQYGHGDVGVYEYGFDIDGEKTAKQNMAGAVQERLNTEVQNGGFSELKENYESDFHSFYGSFLFLGIFLGGLFLMATVLIIYYKQISEGYEDQKRYEIMAKVGMSRKEIRKSIHGQVRLVFFLPLALAVIHVIAAFQLMRKILIAMNLTNTTLFIACTAGTMVVFAAIYLIVFRITAKEYYKIVTK